MVRNLKLTLLILKKEKKIYFIHQVINKYEPFNNCFNFTPSPTLFFHCCSSYKVEQKCEKGITMQESVRDVEWQRHDIGFGSIGNDMESVWTCPIIQESRR